MKHTVEISRLILALQLKPQIAIHLGLNNFLDLFFLVELGRKTSATNMKKVDTMFHFSSDNKFALHNAILCLIRILLNLCISQKYNRIKACCFQKLLDVSQTQNFHQNPSANSNTLNFKIIIMICLTGIIISQNNQKGKLSRNEQRYTNLILKYFSLVLFIKTNQN